MDSLGDVLTKFETEISPWKSPVEWLRADAEHVNSVIQRTVTITKSAEIELAKVAGAMIYRRLIVYIFAHLIHCAKGRRHLSNFKDTLKQWQGWDCITIVQNHQLIKDHLLDMFRRGSQSRRGLHSESLLKKLLTLDVTGLCARLTVIVTDDNRYKEVVALRGPDAQSLLDLLQARLDFATDSAYQSRHVKALIRLSRASGLYPQCLVLKGVEMLGDPVAGGRFGDVYKGRFRGREIAIRVLRVYQKSDMNKLLKEFSSEAVIWQQLSHPNVLPFYGVYHLDNNPPRVCLVCPWMENGNLVQFLADMTPTANCVPLSLDIAQGLEYLHNKNIIHGDLKGLNILVSRSQRACLADFGLATAIHSNSTMKYMSTGQSTGTLRWQAPELFPDMLHPDAASAERRNTMATDVYAFALVCYEMFSGEYPFHDITHDFQVMFAVKQGGRPSRPSHNLSQERGLNDEIWQLIEACWTPDPSERLSAGRIVEQLRANRPVDQRSLDNFNVSFQSQVLQVGHPFSILAATIEGSDMMHT